MDANFSKFKRKVWLFILIKCLLIGLAAAVIALNAVFIPCKICGVKIFWLFYILIALGGFVAGGGVALLCLRTGDKKIAKLLDKELSLQERVQTAYECRSETGDIYDLQRVNASASLNSASSKETDKKLFIAVLFGSVASIVAMVLCCVLIFAGTAAVPVVAACVQDPPASEEEGGAPPAEPPRQVTDWEWAALDELINYVQTSKKLDTFAKTGTINELEGLRRVLLAGVSQSTLPVFVQNTVTNIRNVVKEANEAESASEEQKTLNTEECEVVVLRLYEIFSITPPGGSTDDPKEDDPKEDDPGYDDTQAPPKPGGEELNDTPFYDPQKGYTTVGVALKESGYYEKVQDALTDGTISQEEWAEIMIAYFASLNSNNDN